MANQPPTKRFTAPVTAKNRITIPARIRDELELDQRDVLEVSVRRYVHTPFRAETREEAD